MATSSVMLLPAHSIYINLLWLSNLPNWWNTLDTNLKDIYVHNCTFHNPS